MRNTILLLALALISYAGYSQTEEPVLTFVQTMPSYPAGEKALYDFLYNNITYPEQEKSQNIEGTVFVNFVIEKDGTPSNFIITRGVEGGIGLDREALNACKKLGKFTPGSQNGVPQRVYFTLPIKFKLEDNQAMQTLTSREKLDALKDAIYICKIVMKITEAKTRGHNKRYVRLCSKLELNLTKIQTKYIRGSEKEKLFYKSILPCIERYEEMVSEGK
jgi:hypothetical protein